jgi:hypothetical protein
MDSDTASEEDQTHPDDFRRPLLTGKQVEEASDTSSEEDLTFENQYGSHVKHQC